MREGGSLPIRPLGLPTPPLGLPTRPPFRLRARVLTPLAAGGTEYTEDGIVEVDSAGRIARAGRWDDACANLGPSEATIGPPAATYDLRPRVVLPGLVDLHTHIAQLPNAGVGAGIDLLTWLERYTLPLERRFDAAAADRLAPLACRVFAAAGTTTLAAYATTDADATEAIFRAAEAHGIRAIIGLVLMDREIGAPVSRAAGRGRRSIAGARAAPDAARALDASADLCARWHGRDEGRLSYAFTPRFALSCSSELLRESARLAAQTGAYWQTHLAEDSRELAETRSAFPQARDYLDVYEQAGALDTRALFAHAIHLTEREIARLADSRAAVAHCPASNLFLASGIMPLARYLEAGVTVGLGSDVAGGPDSSVLGVMRAGAYAQHALQALRGERRLVLDPLAWLRLGTLDGARALGLADAIGSIEAGKEADLIAVDPALAEPVPGAGHADGPADIVSRLIFRTHPQMVTAAWVRGRLLPQQQSEAGTGS